MTLLDPSGRHGPSVGVQTSVRVETIVITLPRGYPDWKGRCVRLGVRLAQARTELSSKMCGNPCVKSAPGDRS